MFNTNTKPEPPIAFSEIETGTAVVPTGDKVEPHVTLQDVLKEVDTYIAIVKERPIQGDVLDRGIMAEMLSDLEIVKKRLPMIFRHL